MPLSGFKDSVMELIHFVGRLASVGLQLEGCHCLLLSFVLDFYETVKKRFKDPLTTPPSQNAVLVVFDTLSLYISF